MPSSVPKFLPGPLNSLFSNISAASIPEPFKAVAGLAVVAIDEVKAFPRRVIGLPVAAAGSAMQASMKVQQQYAGLVGKGEELINALHGPSDDIPEWATFDEDALPPPTVARDAAGNGAAGSAFDRVDDEPLKPARRRSPAKAAAPATAATPDGAGIVTPAAAAKGRSPAKKTGPAKKTAPTPRRRTTVVKGSGAPVAGYDELNLPQLRARVKNYNATQLEDLIRYESDGLGRAPYVGILAGRLATLRRN